jgi:hypothetical protein
LKRRSKWLILALLLFAVVAVLGLDRTEPRARKGAKPVFRHAPTEQERAQMIRRRTLPALPTESSSEDEHEATATRRDPLLAALPASAEAVLVFEANDFFEMPVGRLLWNCLSKQVPNGQPSPFAPSRLERIALAIDGQEPLVIMSGDFKGLPRDELEETGGYGNHTTFYRPFGSSIHDGGEAIREGLPALWNEQMFIHAQREVDLRGAIDRLEGKQLSRPAIDPNEAYGEVYGRMGARTLSKLLPQELRERIEASDTSFNFHLDASGDALLMVDAMGDKETTQDIGRVLAGALSMLRVQAASEGKKALASLLDAHAIRMTDDGFQLEAAFPLDDLQRFLGKCAEEPRASAALDGGS